MPSEKYPPTSSTVGPCLTKVLTLLSTYITYYLYLAYAEGLVQKGPRRRAALWLSWGARRPDRGRALRPERTGCRVHPLSVTTIATGLLVIPGMWLYTRWALATPVIREEGICPLAATLRDSNELLSGHFWLVFMTATVAYYLEGVVIHEGALAGRVVHGVAHVGGMDGRFYRGDACDTPGRLRHLAGPLHRRKEVHELSDPYRLRPVGWVDIVLG